MEKDKLGKFLIELRKEKNLTQYDLADMIPISREAVSKWERGKTKPNKASLERLSDIFNVSVEELLLGKRLNKNKRQEIRKLTLELYGNKIFLQRMLKILLMVVIVILLLFLIYYFVTSYNSIRVYTLNDNQNTLTITDGIFVVTKENIYFNLGNIQTDKTIINLKLYYKENKKDHLIFSTDDSTINLYDYYGYNAYFDYTKIDYIINNLYLDISYDNNEIETIKLDYVKDFSNNQIFNETEHNISSDDYNDDYSSIDASIIKNVFEYQDGVYTYSNQDGSLTFLYIEEANLLNLISKEENKLFEWHYYPSSDTLEYNEYQGQNLINSFHYSNNDIICNINNSLKDTEKVNYFYDNLNQILE